MQKEQDLTLRTQTQYTDHQSRLEKAPYFLNFISTSTGTYKQRWLSYFKNNKLFKITMAIEKNSPKEKFYNLTITHSNSRISTHMQRAIYIERIVDSLEVKQKWPVFRQLLSQTKIPKDIFQIKFDREIEQTGRKKYIKMVARIQLDINEDVKDVRISINRGSNDRYFILVTNLPGGQHYRVDLKEASKTCHSLKNTILQLQNQLKLRDFNNLRGELNLQRNPSYENSQENQIAQESQLNVNESLLTSSYVFEYADRAINSYKNQNRIKSVDKYDHQQHPLQTGLEFYLREGKIKISHFLSAIDQLVLKADYIFDNNRIFSSSDGNYICVMLNNNGNMIPVETSSRVLRLRNSKFAFLSTNFNSLTSLPSKRTEMIMKHILILEKCYAKIKGGYENIANGKSGQVFMMLTNCCTQYFTHLQAQIYQEYMWIWQKEMQEMQKIKEKRRTMIQSNFSNFTSREYIQEDNHFITVQIKDVNKKLYTMFEKTMKFDLSKLVRYTTEVTLQQSEDNLKEWIKNLINAEFSFRGIYRGVKKAGQNEDDNIFIKLAGMKGVRISRQFLQRWAFMRNVTLNYIPKSIKVNEIDIPITSTEFVITLAELKKLECTVAVCLCKQKEREDIKRSKLQHPIFQNYFYDYQQVCLQEKKPVFFSVQITQASTCWLALHEERGKNQLSFGNRAFELEIYEGSSRKKLQFLKHEHMMNFSFFKYFFHKQGSFQLRIRLVDSDREVKFCYVSLLSKSEKNRLISSMESQSVNNQTVQSQIVEVIHENPIETFQDYYVAWSPQLYRRDYRLNIIWKFPLRPCLMQNLNQIPNIRQHLLSLSFKEPYIYVLSSNIDNEPMIQKKYLTGIHTYNIEFPKQDKKYLTFVMVNQKELSKWIEDGEKIQIRLEWLPISQMEYQVSLQTSTILTHPGTETNIAE